ncbi:hypothetical protein LP421_24185 [Rhizobium sp. RCAM05350]|nr:hypothetical protein LP421_24185 [Rhizobium sp. RCAM05350]
MRKGATTEEVVGTVIYQPTTQADGGQGTYVANPTGVIDLGSYSNLALRMDIKNDGCDIGYKATVKNSKVSCAKNTNSTYKNYNTVLRTDDPATSNHLFVDGKQVPLGVKASLEKYFRLHQDAGTCLGRRRRLGSAGLLLHRHRHLRSRRDICPPREVGRSAKVAEYMLEKQAISFENIGEKASAMTVRLTQQPRLSAIESPS